MDRLPVLFHTALKFHYCLDLRAPSRCRRDWVQKPHAAGPEYLTPAALMPVDTDCSLEYQLQAHSSRLSFPFRVRTHQFR